MIINKYEIELRLKNRVTGETRMLVRTEHAYNASDAVSQSSMNLSYELLGSNEEADALVYVGPPRADVLNRQQSLVSVLRSVFSNVQDDVNKRAEEQK